MIALASMGLLLQAAKPFVGTGSGGVQIRLRGSESFSHLDALSPSAVSDTEDAAAPPLSEPNEPTATLLAHASDVSPTDISGYLPVSALSERPQLIIDIHPEWYLHDLDLPSISAFLLINEYGDVDDLVIDAPKLTPMLLEDLKMRFRAARFSPGQLDGQPVRVMLHIAIQLD